MIFLISLVSFSLFFILTWSFPYMIEHCYFCNYFTEIILFILFFWLQRLWFLYELIVFNYGKPPAGLYWFAYTALSLWLGTLSARFFFFFPLIFSASLFLLMKCRSPIIEIRKKLNYTWDLLVTVHICIYLYELLKGEWKGNLNVCHFSGQDIACLV